MSARRLVLNGVRIGVLRVVLNGVLSVAAAGCAADRIDVEQLTGQVTKGTAKAGTAREAGAGTARAGRARRLVAVTMAPRTPFAIRNVERVEPPGGGARAGDEFDVAYTVLPHAGAPAPPDARARVTCRIHDLWLAVEPVPEVVHLAAGEARLSTYFRPDPFTAALEECEIAFLHRGAVVGEACLSAGEIVDGGCHEDGAPPVAPARVAMSEVEVAVRDGAVSARAVVTVDATRRGYAARVRCDDGRRVAAARRAVLLSELDGLAPGTSRYVAFDAELAARIGSGRSRCEIAITAGAGRMAGRMAGPGRVLARYCVAERHAVAGPCAPALGSR